MKRINTTASALNTGMAKVDLGDNLTAEIPVGKRYYVVEEAVGRTVKVWDYINNREQVIYGDTGRRNIKASLPTMTEGSISIRRDGNLVTLAIDVAKFSNSGTFTLPGAVPDGFRPDATYNDFAVQLGGTDGWRIGISGAGHLSSYNYTGGWFRCYLVWMTSQPWPTSLPGVAA